MKNKSQACCSGPSFEITCSLPVRPLLSSVQATKVMALFKILANDTRIRLLHLLVRSGEVSVSGIADALGMKPQAISNQLQRLTDLGILASRREGNSIFYRIINPCVALLLDTALCIMDDPEQAARIFPVPNERN